MNAEITVALLSAAGTLIGSLGGILASNRLTNYRIAQLEKRVDKHNNLVERMAAAEDSIKSAHRRIDDITQKIRGIFMRKLFENITKISVGTWVRGILSLVSIINMALTAFGKTPVSVEYSELYTIISLIFTFIVGAASYWKNNSFTSAAIEADKFMHEQRIAEGEDDNGTSL